jgi:hypothetical protein
MVLHMIFFLLPKGVLHKLDYYRSRFFWQGDSEKKIYRLAKWSVVCCPKDQGGLGIHDLSVKNTALLGKWLFKLLTDDGIWQNILKKKYIGFFSEWEQKRPSLCIKMMHTTLFIKTVFIVLLHHNHGSIKVAA